MIGAAWRIATAPTRFAVGVALDVLFGKEEPFEYPLTETIADPLAVDIAQCVGTTDVYFVLDESHTWTEPCEAREQPLGSNVCIEGDRWGH